MTPDEYCQEKTAKSGSSFYYSFLFLPPEQRQAITAVYAFCRQVDDIVDECHEQDVARAKLQWWRNSMQETFAGNPQHPIQHALLKPIQDMQLPLELFLEIIQGMEMDLQQTRFNTFEELKVYCYRVASAVGLLAARIFGYQHTDVLKYAENLGTAFQMTNIIRDIREDANRGRIYIPLEDLERHGVNERDILNIGCGNKTDKRRERDSGQGQELNLGKGLTQDHQQAMTNLLQQQVQRTQSLYDLAFSYLPEADRHLQRCGIIMSALYRRVLTEIEKDVNSVLDRRVSLSPIHKLWIAWTTYRSEHRRYKQFQKTLSVST